MVKIQKDQNKDEKKEKNFPYSFSLNAQLKVLPDFYFYMFSMKSLVCAGCRIIL